MPTTHQMQGVGKVHTLVQKVKVSRAIIVFSTHRVSNIEIREVPFSGPIAYQKPIAICRPGRLDGLAQSHAYNVALQLEIQLAAGSDTKPMPESGWYDNLTLIRNGDT